MTTKRILILAGGTGGHIFPALAVADCLRAQQVTPFWLGSAHGMEGTIVPRHQIELFKIRMVGLRGKGLWRWLLAPLVILRGTWEAARVILRIKPGVVLGMGGFVSGPGGLAAILCRRPLVIHEQNSIPGLTNRLLRYFATRVLAAYPGAFPVDAKAIITGNPVRAEISGVASSHQRACDPATLRILVLGGSLGARSLNRMVPVALGAFQTATRLEIRHQTGAQELEVTQAAYGNCPHAVTTQAFIADMAAAYAWTDLIICRAGALTIAEISMVGIPAILVPFPFAVDDHQTVNAAYLCDRGAAILIPDAALSVDTLCAALHAISDDRVTMAAMAARARAAAYPIATAEVARHCLELIHET